MRCAHCGEETTVTERLEFRARCPACDRPLHSCLNCGFYAKGAYNDCREPRAERVTEKARENRCEWFRPGAGGAAGNGSGDAADRGADRFNDLFK